MRAAASEAQTGDAKAAEANAQQAEEQEFNLGDVRSYYDFQIAAMVEPAEALQKTRKKFKLKGMKVNPAGKLLAPGVPEPPPPPMPPGGPMGGGGGMEPGGEAGDGTDGEEEPEDEKGLSPA